MRDVPLPPRSTLLHDRRRSATHRWRTGPAAALIAVAMAGATACTSSNSIVAVAGSSTSSTSSNEPSRSSTTDDGPTTTDPDDTVDDDSTSTTEAGPLPDPCDLLTEDDVVEAFGEPVEAGEQDAYECWWTSGGAGLKSAHLIIKTGDLDDWRQGFDNDYWTPNDFGDEGYTGSIIDSVEFRIGEVQYDVTVNYSTSGDPDQVVQELAKKVEGRL